MQLLTHLEDYLRYMHQLGFSGLALEHNPFVVEQAEVPVIPQTTRSRIAPPDAPRKPTASRKPKKTEKMNVPNLLAIMDMVAPTSPIEDNRRKAEQIDGSEKVDILRKLHKVFHDCEACALSTTRRCFVFGEGPPDAPLMFVGEGPGYHEDLSGRPFVGDAGQLLVRIIQSMGFQRSDVFITNVIKCRPPENRTPLPDESATCAPILAKQIETVDPKIIVALGSAATRFFKGHNVSIMRGRGQFFQWKKWLVMPTYHPAYILRNPRSKRDVWEDIKQVMARLKTL